MFPERQKATGRTFPKPGKAMSGRFLMIPRVKWLSVCRQEWRELVIEGGADVGMGEIVADEEEGFVFLAREGVGEAIPEVQFGP